MKRISCIISSMIISMLMCGFTNAQSKPIAYFFIPHQDDELLSFGSSIVSHLNTGHDVKIVVFNDGAGSFVRKKIGLSEEEFTDARDSEQINSLKALGVKESNITYIPVRYPDNSLPNYRENVKNIMRHYMLLAPNAKVKTFTPYGAVSMHKDHKTLGEVALELHNEGVISDLRFYIEPYELRNFKVANPNIFVMSEQIGEGEKQRIKKSYESYRYSKYGIGYQSVGGYLDSFMSSPVNYIHK